MPTMNEVSIVPTQRENKSNEVKAAKRGMVPQPSDSKSEEEEEELVIRPKSAESLDKGRVELAGVVEVEMEGSSRQRTMSDVEMAQLKLGLIPPRRRSKSISDGKSSGTATNESEEEHVADVIATTVTTHAAIKHEKADKKWNNWHPHVSPVSASTDNEEAWAEPVAANQDNSHRSPRPVISTAVPAFQRTATAPEMGGPKRRSATMPEYSVMRTSGIGRSSRVLGRGIVRTVKITSYDIPEPRKIHRINLRNYNH